MNEPEAVLDQYADDAPDEFDIPTVHPVTRRVRQFMDEELTAAIAAAKEE